MVSSTVTKVNTKINEEDFEAMRGLWDHPIRIKEALQIVRYNKRLFYAKKVETRREGGIKYMNDYVLTAMNDLGKFAAKGEGGKFQTLFRILAQRSKTLRMALLYAVVPN